VLVARAYNPGYSGGTDQKNGSLKPALNKNNLQDPILKKTFTEEGCWNGSSGKSSCPASVVPLCHSVSCFTPFMPLIILDGTEV
jgi:hypothetical protein